MPYNSNPLMMSPMSAMTIHPMSVQMMALTKMIALRTRLATERYLVPSCTGKAQGPQQKLSSRMHILEVWLSKRELMAAP